MSNLSGQLHNAEVDFHRSIFQIHPVELHVLPGWFAHRVCWAIGSGWGRRDAELRLQRLAHDAGADSSTLFDHWGLSQLADGQSVFVAEPYPQADHAKLLRAVAAIADRLGVHARILTPWQSWWYPGWTVRIEFSECDGVPLCEGCKSREQLRDESRARKRLQRKAVHR